jgi:hypothetical protein
MSQEKYIETTGWDSKKRVVRCKNWISEKEKCLMQISDCKYCPKYKLAEV